MSENNGILNAIVTPAPLRLMNVKNLERIKLNVGGQKFETSADTLKKYESFFSQLLASDIPQKVDAENYILIDRDGTHFGEILNFMRNNSIDFGDNIAVAKAIRAEADFYQLQELIQKCDEFLASPITYFSTYRRGVYTAEERKTMIETGKAIVFLNIGQCFGERYDLYYFEVAKGRETLAKAMIDFLKLRKSKPFIKFVMDYTEDPTAPFSKILMDFYFDQKLIKSVEYYNKAKILLRATMVTVEDATDEYAEDEEEEEDDDMEVPENYENVVQHNARIEKEVSDAMDALQGKMLEKLMGQ